MRHSLGLGLKLPRCRTGAESNIPTSTRAREKCGGDIQPPAFSTLTETGERGLKISEPLQCSRLDLPLAARHARDLDWQCTACTAAVIWTSFCWERSIQIPDSDARLNAKVASSQEVLLEFQAAQTVQSVGHSLRREEKSFTRSMSRSQLDQHLVPSESLSKPEPEPVGDGF